MNILLSWLKEFIDLDGRTPAQISNELENLGHEVEAIHAFDLPKTVVVGHVMKVMTHPNADRLQVAHVDTGNTVRTIVCGAPNLEEGQTVVVALPGTTLPNGLVIEPRTIRGIKSDGMICAADELGLPGDHSGILVLPEGEYRVGDSFAGRSGDAMLDLAITANRGDCLSYLGIARELAAKWKQELKHPLMSLSLSGSDQISVRIDNLELCPIYTARKITTVTSIPLPDLVRFRLDQVGHGTYHPVVDITNYIMEELGVPLHAFDASKISGGIVVRRARPGEEITLLDGKTYLLQPDMLVIADEKKPLAVAGVMGGKDSAVTDHTTDIILEAAYFNPSSVRRTARALGLSTSASYRFERGIDPLMTRPASDTAAQLIHRYCGGTVHKLVIAGAAPKRKLIKVADVTEAINRHLGSHFEQKMVENTIGNLGFESEPEGWLVPSWRHDVSRVEDLAEEVARLAGYDNLPRTILSSVKAVTNPDDTRWLAIEVLKDRLVSLGLTEHIGSSFLSEREIQLLGLNSKDLIKLANPVSQEAAYLRPTQILSLLKVIAKNPIFSDLKVFEIGTVWTPAEQTMLSLVWTGNKPLTLPHIPGQELGRSVDNGLLQKLKIRRPVMVSEIPIELALQSIGNSQPTLLPPKQVIYRHPSRFQPVLRDIAILIDQKVSPEEIATELLKVERVVDVELFDQFRGDKLPEGMQSLAFHLLLEHPDKSLTDDEIKGVMEQVTKTVQQKFHAKLR